MNKIFKSTFIAAAITLSLGGCTDLDEEIFDELTSADFPRSDEEYIAALGAAYTSLYNFGNNNTVWGLQEVTSDEVAVPTRGRDWDDGGTWRQLQTHDFNSELGFFNNGWSFCFGGVATCNRLIFQFEQLRDQGTQGTEASIAELQALRALYYLWLIDMYGNVPIVTAFAGADPNPANNTRTEVFNFIEQELIDSFDLLDTSVGGAAYGRMNYWAAKTVLAKLYLNAEVYTGTPRYDDAEEVIDEIINSGNFALAGDYFDNFAVENQSSPEFIFAIPYDEVFAKGFNLPMMTLHYGSEDTYNIGEQPWNGFCTLQEFYESYDDDDVRKESFITGPQITTTGEPVEDPSVEVEDPDGPQVVFTPNIDALDDALRQQGARIGKFEFEVGLTRDLNNDFPVLRYGDVLLMKAEVALRQGDQSTALMMANQLRRRAEVEEFNEINLESLLAERGREMFVEGHRRSDLIRFGAFNDAWWEKPISPAHTQLFPIPFAQINANPSLQQNPGY